jgi:Glycosyltransferases, probably involved in cell wall biogenesis
VSLYTAYNLTLFFYSFKYKYIITPKQKLIESPSVAILYMTCNDFNKQSIDSIKNLSYQNKSIYIVDDSSKPEYKEAIDNIDGVTIIRRDNREGFKAGSINNALKQITADYISICDSDELVPIDYIERSLEYFTDNSIAFVQASHYAYNKHNNWTIAMGNGIDLHWTTYQKYRNNGIVVNFLGHGAILKTSVIREVGGMPLLVSEDIALTVEIYKAGYKGVFADSVQVGEATPETYSQFKRRHKKWSMGAMEFLKKYLIKIITSKNLSVSQKEDLVLSTLSLPLSALFILFIIGTFFIPIKATIPLIALSALAILSPQLVFFKLKGIKNILKSIIINAIAFMSYQPLLYYLW